MSSYRHWQLVARRLLEPLAALMHPGRAGLEIYGTSSDHDAQADRLESFARPLTLAALDEQHLGYSYNLGFKAGQVNTGVETFVFWRAGWLLQVHRVEPRQPVVLRVGAFALPLAANKAANTCPPMVLASATLLSFFSAAN